jgi:hypothetical protein
MRANLAALFLCWALIFTLNLAAVLTNAGRDILTNRILGSGTEPKFIGWGTGAGTAAVADTTLFTESAEARATGTSSRVTSLVANDTYQVVGTLTASAPRTITNAGLLDASTSGNLFIHFDHSSTVLGTGESIQYTVKIQFT